MTTYVDSSALVPVYVPEQFSASARVAVRAGGQIPFTALHDLEVHNAFEVLVGRRVLTSGERDAVRRQLMDDLDSHRLLAVAMDCDRVFAEAMRLSRDHSATLLTRSLDLLHVAAAHVIGCRTFVSADERQIALADTSGLATVDVRRRRQKR